AYRHRYQEAHRGPIEARHQRPDDLSVEHESRIARDHVDKRWQKQRTYEFEPRYGLPGQGDQKERIELQDMACTGGEASRYRSGDSDSAHWTSCQRSR